jgi:hypothetical protein
VHRARKRPRQHQFTLFQGQLELGEFVGEPGDGLGRIPITAPLAAVAMMSPFFSTTMPV